MEKYPLEIKQQNTDHLGMSTRADNCNRAIKIGKSSLTQKTCVSDAIKLWNVAPETIKRCLSIHQAKKKLNCL